MVAQPNVDDLDPVKAPLIDFEHKPLPCIVSPAYRHDQQSLHTLTYHNHAPCQQLHCDFCSPVAGLNDAEEVGVGKGGITLALVVGTICSVSKSWFND